MASRALGLIEVYGMLGAVLAADAALKAADVKLLGNRRVRGGLTTVELIGDVAAIHASVEAGVEAVKDMNCYVTSHVIARLDEQVERMLLQKYEKQAAAPTVEEKTETETEIDAAPETEPDVAPQPVPQQEEPSKEESVELTVHPETLETLITETIVMPEEVIREASPKPKEGDGEVDEEVIHELAALEKMKVSELRSLAYQRNIPSLTKKEIKFANKATLISALLEKGVKE